MTPNELIRCLLHDRPVGVVRYGDLQSAFMQVAGYTREGAKGSWRSLVHVAHNTPLTLWDETVRGQPLRTKYIERAAKHLKAVYANGGFSEPTDP